MAVIAGREGTTPERDFVLVGRCCNCKSFVPGEEICGGLAQTNDSCARSITPDGRMIYVYPEFGCVMWESKNSEPSNVLEADVAGRVSDAVDV